MSVDIRSVSKRFDGQPAVDGVTASLEDGEFFVVLGPSGCGKSTLLRLVAGLERVDHGQIRLDDRAVSGPGLHVAPEDRAVGVVFQSYALWPHMSVRDNVAFPAEARGASRGAARAEAERHLETVALGPYAGRLPAALSGGQRQRVALARCLAGGARTVLMDEPLANLDPHLRGLMETEIARFHRETGVTTLYITHDQREAMALAGRIAVMGQGRFLQVAEPATIHDRPGCEEVARFIGRAAVLDAVVRHRPGGCVADLGPFSVPLSEPVPEGLRRVVLRPGDVPLGQGVPALLSEVFYRGGVWEAMAGVAELAEPLPVSSLSPLREGGRVEIAPKSGWALPS